MSFTTPCFIRKNTPELRNKLDVLGYRMMCPNEYGILECSDGWINDCSDESDLDGIDCGANEDLFLAIAALRDDTDKYQYFVINFDTRNHKKGDFIFSLEHQNQLSALHAHKATVPELLKHVKTEKK